MAQFVLDISEKGIRAAAKSWTDLAHSLQNEGQLMVDIPASLSADEWSGRARDAVCAEITGLGENLMECEPLIGQAAQILENLANVVRDKKATVRQLNTLWTEAIAEAQERARNSTSVNVSEHIPVELAATQRGLQGRFDHAHEEVRVACVNAANAIRTKVVTRVPASVLAEFRSGGGTGASVGWGDGPVWADDTSTEQALAADQPLLAARLAREDAEDALRLVGAATQGDTDALATLKARFGDRAKDPYFALEFSRQLGAAGYANTAADMVTHLVRAQGLFGEDEAQVAADNGWLTRFMGTNLATAANPASVKGIPAELRIPMDTWREKEFFPELRTTGRQRVERPDQNFSFYGYWAYGQYVAAAAEVGVSAGAEFHAKVGLDVLAWDRDLDGATRTADWAAPHQIRADSTPIRGPFDPVPESPEPKLILANLTDSANQLLQDPISGFLASAKVDGASARAFLTTPINQSHNGADGMRYLMLERPKVHDLHQLYPDEGALLGQTIIAADHDDTSPEATHAAQEFVGLYLEDLNGKKEERSKYQPWTTKEPAHRLSLPGLRPAMGSVLAYHIESLQGILDADRSQDKLLYANAVAGEVDRLPNGHYGLLFPDPSSYGLMISDLARDRPEQTQNTEASHPNAFQTLARAQLNYLQQDISQSSLGTQSNADPLKHAIANGTQNLGFIVEKGQASLTAQGAATDAAHKYVIDQCKTLTDAIPADKLNPAVGGIKKVAGPLVNAGVKHALPTDNATKQIQENLSYEESISKLVRHRVEEELNDRNDWPPGRSPREWATTHPGKINPTNTFYDTTGRIKPIATMTTEEIKAYREWKKDPKNGVEYLYQNFGDQATDAIRRGKDRATHSGGTP